MRVVIQTLNASRLVSTYSDKRNRIRINSFVEPFDYAHFQVSFAVAPTLDAMHKSSSESFMLRVSRWLLLPLMKERQKIRIRTEYPRWISPFRKLRNANVFDEAYMRRVFGGNAPFQIIHDLTEHDLVNRNSHLMCYNNLRRRVFTARPAGK